MDVPVQIFEVICRIGTKDSRDKCYLHEYTTQFHTPSVWNHVPCTTSDVINVPFLKDTLNNEGREKRRKF